VTRQTARYTPQPPDRPGPNLTKAAAWLLGSHGEEVRTLREGADRSHSSVEGPADQAWGLVISVQRGFCLSLATLGKSSDAKDDYPIHGQETNDD
jgi:hypothetical protein